jgi:small subunit ribosomal protein S9
MSLYIYSVGKRKTAIARVKLFADGKGEVKINERDLTNYFSLKEHVDAFLSPFKVIDSTESNYDLQIKVVGGGVCAQVNACQHGITRALVKEDESRRIVLKRAGFLTRDSRTKERNKPGLKRARRSPQWSKR